MMIYSLHDVCVCVYNVFLIDRYLSNVILPYCLYIVYTVVTTPLASLCVLWAILQINDQDCFMAILHFYMISAFL